MKKAVLVFILILFAGQGAAKGVKSGGGISAGYVHPLEATLGFDLILQMLPDQRESIE